jgi:predicted RNA-binding protein associated with RNAse of E/G family
MVRPESGEAVITRFDVVRDVEIDAPGEVRYTDLFLDLRIEHGAARRETAPWETVSWEDEDEVAAAARAGLLSPADRRRIDRARAVLDRGHARITAEVRRLLRSLGRLPA